MLKIENRLAFENNCWVGLVDSFALNSSEQERINAVTDIASITKGKLGFNHKGKEGEDSHYYNEDMGSNICSARQRLYYRLLVESAGRPSTPFEFIPVVENVWNFSNAIINNYYRHGILIENRDTTMDCYTNLRNTIKNSIANDNREIHYIKSGYAAEFKVIVGRVPMKVISHLRTHRAFSWLVESSRNKRYLNEVEFWYPSWWSKFYIEGVKGRDYELINDLKIELASDFIKPEEATMELSDRRLVHFAMAAWKQDSNAWDNLFDVRGNNTGTMNITGQTVNNIKTLINV